MKCMCAQTRPRFILSSEGVLGGMEFEPMLTPREKSPLPENIPRGGSNPRRCGQRAQALPTELFRPPLACLMPHPHAKRTSESSALTVSHAATLREILFVGCLLAYPSNMASESQGRICSEKFTCCHTEIEVADQTSISPSHSLLTPG